MALENMDDILGGLNAQQLEAVKTLSRVVVTAGAGSGKTKVLASRFAYLVIEKGFKVDEILTLTFTNKATNEMYSRIYKLLSSRKDAASAAAVRDFYKARISTLDSFCAEICALGSARYGIRNDFTPDAADGAAYDMASDAALSFVLDNRASPGIQALIADNKIRDIAQGIFAKTVTEYGSITNPLPFGDYIKKQRDELVEKWRGCSARAGEAVVSIKNELTLVKKTTTATYGNFYRLFSVMPDLAPPDAEALFEAAPAEEKNKVKDAVYRFLDTLAGINRLRKVSNAGGMEAIREVHGDFKDNVYPLLVKLAAMILNFDTVRDVFLLLDKFQRDFNDKKRIAGIMTFNDVAELALAILKNEADIRNIYAEKIRAVMIDEFQDNNELQRELLFLLGCENIFFVGDQKQSIYRFRGADVSVFKKLEHNIEKNIRLKINYRSGPNLIRAFNGIFGRVFPEKTAETPDFEAEYEPLESAETPDFEAEKTARQCVQICLFDKNDLARDAECGADDVEAAFVAKKIRLMVDGGYRIKSSDGFRRCGYDDFAVLERSVSRQHILEKHLRAFGVPYNSENCAGLFIDAPANDIYSFLRLLVYPKDRSAYAAVLRSALARLSDIALTVCMLKFTGVPFDAAVENELPEYDVPLYRRARGIYYELLDGMREHNLSCAEIITRLWYDYGYRYETLWSSEAQIYNDIYDYLFELARICDARGKTQALFIDYIDSIASKDERLPDFYLPLERRQGVKIMTIHKSKGLEFPVVFVYGCGGRGQNVKNTGLVSFSRDWGVSLNLMPPEKFPADARGNYFFELTRETEKQKEEAELRRLLYVAMTRAEDTLVLTGVEHTKNNGVKSFIDLITPALAPALDAASGGGAIFSYEKIAPETRASLREAASRYGMTESRPAFSMREKAEAAAALYAVAGDAEKPVALITQKPAGSRRVTGAKGSLAAAETDGALFDGLTPAEFGSLVHRTIEERFAAGGGSATKAGAAAASGPSALADRYASVFFQSEIGQKSLASSYRKTEYAFLSLIEEGGVKRYVSGVIDLLFEAENEMYIVDYKTDRTVDPEKYAAQLAAYTRAVRDIFSKSTRAFLFYLREGRLVEM